MAKPLVGKYYYGQLNAVVRVTATNAWAVGYEDSYGAQIVHWNGTSWKQVPAPDLTSQPHSNNYPLRAISASAANNIWAVGGQPGNPVIIHYNGTSWKIMALPPGCSPCDINGVVTTSAKSMWAVGEYQTHSSIFVHWDGKSLKFVGEPFTGATALELNSMAASSATNIWAGGWWDLTPNATLTVHFNGSSWQRVFAGLGQFQPSMGVNGMATTKATDTWAAGCLAGSTGATYNTGILHFTGAWAKLALPSEPGTSSCLTGVAATSTTNAWAVGYYVVPDTATNTNVPHLVLLRWDGKAWKAVAL